MPDRVITQSDRDEALVKSCLSGNRKAFGVLVERYEKKLYNVAYRIIRDPDDAMDATQSAFVKAYEKLDTFNFSYRFFSWIYRILLNESLTLAKRRSRFHHLDGDVALTARNPEERYDESETSSHIQDALMSLKTDYRVVIVLKHFQDLSYREMAEVLEIPEKTVKSRLFTARRLLRDVLSKRGISR